MDLCVGVTCNLLSKLKMTGNLCYSVNLTILEVGESLNKEANELSGLRGALRVKPDLFLICCCDLSYLLLQD